MRRAFPLFAALFLFFPPSIRAAAAPEESEKKTDLERFVENRDPERAEGLADFLKDNGLDKNALLLGEREDSPLLAVVPVGPGARAAVFIDPDTGKTSVIRAGEPDAKTGKRPLYLLPVDAAALARMRKDPAAGIKALRAASAAPIGEDAEEIPYPFHAQLYKASRSIAKNQGGPVEEAAVAAVTDCINGICSAGVSLAKQIPFGETPGKNPQPQSLFDAFARKTARKGLRALEEAYERPPPGFVANRVPARVYANVRAGLEDPQLRRARIEPAVAGALRGPADAVRAAAGFEPKGGPAVPTPQWPSSNSIANEALESTLLYKLSREKK